VTDEYINRAIETLQWLGLNWDEGPQVGGPYGPYLQSQRLEIYTHWAKTFVANGDAYNCYCSTEELEKRREKQRELNQAPGYDGKCRSLSADEISEFEKEGRKPVIRMRMPDGETRFTDLIRGEVTFEHKYVPDFVLMRADGSPLYTLAVAVDDVLMKVTHVLRGEDLLSSTPRQIRVYQAMGVAPEDFPLFAHLPFVMGQDNAKLSKRNGEVSIAWYREQGFLPEAICNYLALLGWSPGDDVENITMEELVQLFTVERVNSSPARFDMKKLEAINGDKIRALTIDDFLSRALPFLMKDGVIQGSDEEIAIVKSALPIIQERIARMNEVTAMLKFLFVEDVIFDAESETKVKEEPSQHVISQALSALENVNDWKHEVIEAALRAVLIEKLGLKPRLAFGPVRIAVTGSHISPPLFESMELLGRARSLARLKAAVR
jgi:glutamyl-tRNA synthetase